MKKKTLSGSGWHKVSLPRLNCGAALLLVLFLTSFHAFAQAPTVSDSSVVTLDPLLGAIISPDAKMELMKTGFGSAEGTNWIKEGKTGYLVFSDIAANVIYKMTQDGQVSVLLDRSGYTGYDIWNNIGGESTNGKDPKDPLFRHFYQIGSNGLTVDPQGRIVVAGWAGRNVYRIEKDGKRTILADRYEGKRLGGPNDIIVKKDGSIYFTDTFGGMRGRQKDPTKELDIQGIYMIKDGKLTLQIYDIPPNGLALSPDEKYLYVTAGAVLKRYDVQPDDTTKNGQLFIDMSADKTPGAPDGLRVDSKGNVYSAGPGGVWIISPEGKHLGTILVPEIVTNLCFGDPDYKSLYIATRMTARSAFGSIFKIQTITTGIQ